jgi:predicted lipoprotein with Yx(FWY)xxD motif
MTTRRPARLKITAIALAAIAASVAIAACGDDDSDSDTAASGGATTTAPAAGASAISVQSIDGLDALVDSEGRVLYTNDKDSASKIACTGECETIWLPATASGQPTSDDPDVEAKLGVTTGASGESQVTFDGLPLYSFTEEGPGQVTGNGFVDAFAGVTFTWTAATSGGSQQGAGTTTEGTTGTGTEDSGGGSDDSSGSGGYGY